jgi:hypothetical protein
MGGSVGSAPAQLSGFESGHKYVYKMGDISKGVANTL